MSYPLFDRTLRYTILSAFVAVFVFAPDTTAVSDDAPQVVVSKSNGPTLILPEKVEAPIGQPVVIDPETNGEIVRYVVQTPGLIVFPNEQLSDPTNAVVWSLRAGQYKLLAYTAVDNVPSKPAIVTVIVGDAPGPGPEPEPEPEPEPAPNDLTAKVKSLVAKVNSPTKADDQKAVAELFTSIAGQVGAGGVSDFTELGDILKVGLAQGLGPAALNWAEVIKLLGEELTKVEPDVKKAQPILEAFAAGAK